MAPVFEQRVTIPYYIFRDTELSDIQVIIVAVAGNIFIGIAVYLFIAPLLSKIKDYLYIKFSNRIWIFNLIITFINWLFNRTIKNTDKINKAKFFGLILFVGIPLPLTGVWTGALAAYLFKLDRKTSISGIILGVLLCALIVGGVSISGNQFFFVDKKL